jgi:O-antigen/teichoic acid export membrane protein
MAAEKSRSKLESEKQRWDRNFADLLQELRVTQTGVQILFAFLLTLPFSAQFTRVNEFQKDIYIVALLAAAAATAMIISPVAFHRALFRQGRKPELVRFSHRMASGGLFFMLIAMVSSVLLITDFLLPLVPAVILTVITGAWFLTFWAVLPFVRRNWTDGDDEDDYDEEDVEPATGPARNRDTTPGQRAMSSR